MSNVKIVDNAETSANGLVPVQLINRFGNVNPGEIAGYRPEIAADLVKGGHAKFVAAEKAEPKK